MDCKSKDKSPKGKKSKKNDEGESKVAAHQDEETKSAAPTISNNTTGTSRGKRGVVAMHKVLVKKALGRKLKVKYNELGNPEGKVRCTLQSYIRKLARTMVPININSWPSVDRDLKDKLWIDIQDTFTVAPESKKLILSSAGVKWRGFKTMLTKNYVLPYLGNKKALRKPPKSYKFVGLKPWKEFVKQRSSEDWKMIHERQSERVKKRKYHHRLSKKGYIGLDEELRESLPDGEVIDRAVMWKAARDPKDGKIDEDSAEVASKIDLLLEQKKKGELEISGSDDVLTQALGTPEHSGRVRGVGGFVNPSTYFKMPKQKTSRITKAELLARDKQRAQELEDTKKLLMEQQTKTEEAFHNRIAQLEALIKGELGAQTMKLDKDLISDKGSCYASGIGLSSQHPQGETVQPKVDCHIGATNAEKDGLCELALDTINNIVAFGTVFESKGLNEKIHGVPMPAGCVRVSVDGPVQPDAPLPIPVRGEMEWVKDVVGSHVAWPEELVIRKVLNPKKKNKVDVNKSVFAKAVTPHAMVPKRYWLLYKYAKTLMRESGLSTQLQLSNEVFGHGRELCVLSEDITNFLEMNTIGQAVIVAYMAHLHEVLTRKDELDIFAFVDLAHTYRCERKEFIPYIVDRLKEGKADRLFLIPYNPGGHWILTTIYEDEIYVLDSMPKITRYKQWEDSVISAVKMFNAETGRFNKAPKLKHLMGVPKQPGGVECGFYVMRYMKDIISDDSLSFSNKWATKTRKEHAQYTQQQIDEVRVDVADYLQALM